MGEAVIAVLISQSMQIDVALSRHKTDFVSLCTDRTFYCPLHQYLFAFIVVVVDVYVAYVY